MKKANVLIFPAGAENAIEIYDALKYNLHFEVFGASSKHDYAEFMYPTDKYSIGDYNITSEHFFQNLNNLLERFGVDYIIPTHDTIALFLKEHENELSARVVCSNAYAAHIARNKIDTFEVFKDCDFVPHIYTAPFKDINYPVFVKPNIGEGAKNTQLIMNAEEFSRVSDDETIVVSEYLPGMEYTVDCFTDRHGKLLFAGARTRQRIGMGITFQSVRKETTPQIRKMAEEISGRMNLRGAWFFQVKDNVNGEPKLMEFSVRMAGTMVFYRQLGINFPALSLFDAMDMDVSVIFNDCGLKIERCIKTAFRLDYEFDTLYLDYDDTLVVNGCVNTTVIKLVYQTIEKGKKVVLLTKHEGDLEDSFRQYRISPTLFDEIIILKPGEDKGKYIPCASKSVLVDNYFPERKRVLESCRIPVFDVDAAGCLIDESML